MHLDFCAVYQNRFLMISVSQNVRPMNINRFCVTASLLFAYVFKNSNDPIYNRTGNVLFFNQNYCPVYQSLWSNSSGMFVEVVMNMIWSYFLIS